MLVCEICGMEAVEVFTCSKCEAKFCKECGDVKNKLCYDCQGWESEELGEGFEEEDWDRSWEGNDPHLTHMLKLRFKLEILSKSN